jgi:demethylmenaquinone methyltransferase/2-methoxy-6-polyprenyl-1,4-benzoquinol methylase
VVAADFSEGMLEVGRRRHAGNPRIEFVHADATDLPFDDDSFDAVTISFGLRNVVEPKKGLDELLRVLKPGGRIVICEFSTPPVPLVRRGYDLYMRTVAPALTKLVSSNASAYEYLNESIQAWPDQATLSSWLREAGFASVEHRDLTAGIVALHRGVKPVGRHAAPRPAAS